MIVDRNSISVKGLFIPNSPIQGWMYLSPHTCTMQVFRSCMNCTMDLVVTVVKDISDTPIFWVDSTSVAKFRRPSGPPMNTYQLQMLFDSASTVWHFNFTFNCFRCGCLFDMELAPLRMVGMIVSCRASAKAVPVNNPQKWVFPLEVQWALWRFKQNLPFRYVFDNHCSTAHGLLDDHRTKYGNLDWRALSDVWGTERQDMPALTLRGQAEWQNTFPGYQRQARSGSYGSSGLPEICAKRRFDDVDDLNRASKRHAVDKTTKWIGDVAASTHDDSELCDEDDDDDDTDDGCDSDLTDTDAEDMTDSEDDSLNDDDGCSEHRESEDISESEDDLLVLQQKN